ncbi:MAG: hypothetical protein OEZ34_10775 [Spirochaetia bacterium]|nr:hypothetical protein [Spirochaetia bacterium]
MNIITNAVKNMALISRGPLPVTVFNDLSETTNLPDVPGHISEYELRFWSLPETDDLIIRTAFTEESSGSKIYCIWTDEIEFQDILENVLDVSIMTDRHDLPPNRFNMMNDLLWKFISLMEEKQSPVGKMLIWDQIFQ